MHYYIFRFEKNTVEMDMDIYMMAERERGYNKLRFAQTSYCENIL